MDVVRPAPAVLNPDISAPLSARGEFGRHWPIVFASFLGVGLGLSPLPFYTAGIFAPILAAEFGWKIGEIMAGIAIQTIMMPVAAPVVGLLAQRFGPRPVALVSLVAFSFAFMALALNRGSLPLFYLNWAMLAITGAGTLPITFSTLVNRHFNAAKGLALGLSMMGTGLFGFFCKPYAAWLIAEYGWRAAYVGIGLLPLLIATPVVWLMFRDPDAGASTDPARTAPAKPGGLTASQALRDWRFWLMLIVFLPISFALSGPIPNMENILKSADFAPSRIVQLTSLIGLAAISGRLIGGLLLDRLWAPLAAMLVMALPAIALFLLAQPTPSESVALMAVLFVGFAAGFEYDLIAYLAARYFGMRAYSLLYGILFVSFALGAGAGPLFFGRSFDANGDYSSILVIASLLLVASTAALFALGRYRHFPPDDPASIADPIMEQHP